MLDYSRQEGVLVYEGVPYYMVDIVNSDPKIAIFYDINKKSLKHFNQESLKGNPDYTLLHKDNNVTLDRIKINKKSNLLTGAISKLGYIISQKLPHTKEQLRQKYKPPVFVSSVETCKETHTGELKQCFELKKENGTSDGLGIFLGIDHIIITKTVYSLDDFGKYDNLVAMNFSRQINERRQTHENS